MLGINTPVGQGSAISSKETVTTFIISIALNFFNRLSNFSSVLRAVIYGRSVTQSSHRGGQKQSSQSLKFHKHPLN